MTLCGGTSETKLPDNESNEVLSVVASDLLEKINDSGEGDVL